MADLRELLAGFGYADIKTHLQSGNAMFTSRSGNSGKLALEIEKGIKDAMGLRIRCLVRGGDELLAVVARNPFQRPAADGSKLFALFLSAPPDPALLAAHDPEELARGKIHVDERVIYHWCPDGFLAAPNVAEFAEKYLKVTVTVRNWNTVTRLAAMMA
ncbi:MAG: DUF1697 domain-containing protein [Candidatus Dormibacteraceae bacterium]